MKLMIDNLAVERGEDLIFSGLSLTVSSGEIVTVEGTNGAGKSTFLRALAGLLPIVEGTITFTGTEEFAGTTLDRACHYLGHENAMKPQMSVGDNLAFWQSVAGHPHLDPAEALECVGLPGLSPVPFGHLSTGQRRRAAIARLLVAWRPVWLLDEPTAGLDLASRRQFVAIMDTHRDDGGLIVAATHEPLDGGRGDARRVDINDYTPRTAG